MGTSEAIETLCSKEHRIFQHVDKQLAATSEDLLLHSIWFMGNIICENETCCGYVLKNSQVLSCLERLSKSAVRQGKISEKLAEICTWFISMGLQKIKTIIDFK